MGVERIEQLRALPRDALATRFGAEVAVELDRTLGHAEETIEPIRPAVSFEVVREFDGPVVSSEAIIAAVRQLLSELAAMLAARQLGTRAVRVTLRRVRAESVGLRCALTCPNHDEAHWWTLLRPRLERVQLGYGVEEIQIRAARPTRVRPTQLTLWPDVGGESAGGLARALGTWMDQVLDRWGAESVARIATVASYVPERAFRVVPCGERSRECAARVGESGTGGWHESAGGAAFAFAGSCGAGAGDCAGTGGSTGVVAVAGGGVRHRDRGRAGTHHPALVGGGRRGGAGLFSGANGVRSLVMGFSQWSVGCVVRAWGVGVRGRRRCWV
jgi:hypothetical protein